MYFCESTGDGGDGTHVGVGNSMAEETNCGGGKSIRGNALDLSGAFEIVLRVSTVRRESLYDL